MEFNYYNSIEKIEYLNEMKETLEKKIPVILESWKNLAPYTNTTTNRWKKDLDRDLEIIGTGHYTVLKSLNFIRRNKDEVRMNDTEQRYKNIYYHFGLIIDCIKQISRSILIFENKLGKRESVEKKKSEEEIINQTRAWIKDNKYNDSFEKLETFGVSISLPIQPEKEYISILEPDNKKINKYNQFRNSIQQYRNILIHNPSVDIFYRSDLKGIYVVKKEQLKNYRFLNEIDKIDINLLVIPATQTNSDYDKCIDAINEVWTIFLNHIQEINSHPDFEEKSKKTMRNKM